MASKSSIKTIFQKLPVDSADTLWVKNFAEILYLTPFPK